MNNISASFYDPLDTNVDYPVYFRQTKDFKGKFLNVSNDAAHGLNNMVLLIDFSLSKSKNILLKAILIFSKFSNFILFLSCLLKNK